MTNSGPGAHGAGVHRGQPSWRARQDQQQRVAFLVVVGGFLLLSGSRFTPPKNSSAAVCLLQSRSAFKGNSRPSAVQLDFLKREELAKNASLP